MLQGQCEGDLYPIKPNIATIQPKTGPFSASSVSGDLWHHRLGHPSFKILRLLIKFLHLPARISSTSFCKDCAMGKSTQQPFSIVDRRARNLFFDPEEVIALSPRKLGIIKDSSLLFNYKEISTLMEICSIIQVNTD